MIPVVVTALTAVAAAAVAAVVTLLRTPDDVFDVFVEVDD